MNHYELKQQRRWDRETKAVLLRAIRILQRGWTQCAEARMADGKETDFKASGAVSFCMVGALNRASLRANGRFDSNRAAAAYHAKTMVRARLHNTTFEGFDQSNGATVGIVEFNDFIATNRQDVIDVLARVADEVEVGR